MRELARHAVGRRPTVERRRQFRRRQEGARVVDDVLATVVEVRQSVEPQVLETTQRGLPVLVGRPFGAVAERGCDRQRRSSHATALAPARLVVVALVSELCAIRAQLALLGILRPGVEQRRVPEPRPVLHAQQPLGAVERLVPDPFQEQGRRPALGVDVPDTRQHPHHQRRLLGVHEIRIREMTQVLAVVPGGVVPAAVHVAHGTVADTWRRAISGVPHTGAPLTLDVVDDVGDELVAMRSFGDREALALPRASTHPPVQGVPPGDGNSARPQPTTTARTTIRRRTRRIAAPVRRSRRPTAGAQRPAPPKPCRPALPRGDGWAYPARNRRDRR